MKDAVVLDDPPALPQQFHRIRHVLEYIANLNDIKIAGRKLYMRQVSVPYIQSQFLPGIVHNVARKFHTVHFPLGVFSDPIDVKTQTAADIEKFSGTSVPQGGPGKSHAQSLLFVPIATVVLWPVKLFELVKRRHWRKISQCTTRTLDQIEFRAVTQSYFRQYGGVLFTFTDGTHETRF